MTAQPITSTAITDGQKKQYLRFVEDAAERALREATPDKDGLQRLLERGNEFQADVVASIRNHSLSNQFADEEVSSNYGYLSGYTKPVAVTDQIDILRLHWPALNPDAAIRYAREIYPTLQHPLWVEGPFALIRPGFFSDKYGEELEEVLSAIRKDRQGKCSNYCDGKLGEQYLRQTGRALSVMSQFVDRQPGSDILIVGEQFGIRHRGRSVRRVREICTGGEYGEGAKNVGTMILTNPIRLRHFDDLWINCAGDEFAPGADGVFVFAPCLPFYDGKVRFNTDHVDLASIYYGSASGFVPQG